MVYESSFCAVICAEEGGRFGIFGVGFGQRLRGGQLMRLTQVGDNHGYACSADGFGGGDFETYAYSVTTRRPCVFGVFDSMGDTFGVVGFGLVLEQSETAMKKFRLAMSI